MGVATGGILMVKELFCIWQWFWKAWQKHDPNVEPCSLVEVWETEQSPADYSHSPAVGTETHLGVGGLSAGPGPQLGMERKVTQVSLLKTAKGGETAISTDYY